MGNQANKEKQAHDPEGSRPVFHPPETAPIPQIYPAFCEKGLRLALFFPQKVDICPNKCFGFLERACYDKVIENTQPESIDAGFEAENAIEASIREGTLLARAATLADMGSVSVRGFRLGADDHLY